MSKALIVIDVQNDFVNGSLGTKEAEAIIPAVIKKIRQKKDEGWDIIYTRDTHGEDYLSTNEGKNLPVVHCVKGSAGWEIFPGVYEAGSEIIDKPTFGYSGWGKYDFEEIELIGLCTDICVATNALILKTLFPEIDISVDAGCCAGVTKEKHIAALETLKSCQIKVYGE